MEEAVKENTKKNSPWEVLQTATRLGITSFGGPIAHLGYFREEYVNRRKWIDEKKYADLVALCQFLPGPASSQVGIAIGFMRAGYLGALAAWIGFTLPSVIALIIFAYFVKGSSFTETGWLHGLLVVAVAVVAQAVWGMAKNLAADRPRGTIAIIATIITLLVPNAIGQVGTIIGAGVIGWLLFREHSDTKIETKFTFSSAQKRGMGLLILFFILLFGLPILRQIVDWKILALLDSFYRSGALVFGGGHVVLPLLQSEVVPTGWVTQEEFLSGYGAAQAVPGPLFTFASYLGMVANGWSGAIIATIGIFLPAFLLIIGALPFWDWLRHHPSFAAALRGINAAVVGILLAALYDPVWTKAIHTSLDFVLVLISFSLLVLWKFPPWIVVIVGAVGGYVFSYF
ncbi:chromate transporter [Bacillus sp. OTU530]|uniref:chromate transporter n=1 Tax=Bacillus sp. OTU530 TaxID=3043862 RepID=UPI00313E4AD8